MWEVGAKVANKGLRALNRAELLEMLISVSRENEKLKADIRELEAKLAQKEISVERAGTLAEASLKLSGVFEAADAAAQQYLDNLKNSETKAAQTVAEAEDKAKSIVAEAQAEAKRTLEKAKAEADAYWNEAICGIKKTIAEYKGLGVPSEGGATEK